MLSDDSLPQKICFESLSKDAESPFTENERVVYACTTQAEKKGGKVLSSVCTERCHCRIADLRWEGCFKFAPQQERFLFS
jgi:hypothetical protein